MPTDLVRWGRPSVIRPATPTLSLSGKAAADRYRRPERSLGDADSVVSSPFSKLALGGISETAKYPPSLSDWFLTEASPLISNYAGLADSKKSSFSIPLEHIWATNYDALAEAAIYPRDTVADDSYTGSLEEAVPLRFNIPESYPEAPPRIQVADVHLTPSQARRRHGATRAATAFERTSLTRRLYIDTSCFSGADASDLIKLLSGRTPPQRSGDARRDHARLRSLWDEVQTVLRALRQVAPPSTIARGGRQALISALKSTRARLLSLRTKLPPTPSSLVSCAAASAALANDIMRHGPPVAACQSGPRPGASRQ
jgi:hypothetical protein